MPDLRSVQCTADQSRITAHQFPQPRRWVPKLARRYVKPEDICFSDVIQYNPRLLKQAPYRLPVSSTLPLLGDKVKSYVHAWSVRSTSLMSQSWLRAYKYRLTCMKGCSGSLNV